MPGERVFRGARLKELRLARGLTRDRLIIAAAELGRSISLSTLERLEQGETESPRGDNLELLARLLKVKIDDFFVSPVASSPGR